MTAIWRFLKVFTLGTWVGAMIFFGFVAGVLFTQLKSPDEAGNIVGILLWGLHIIGIVAAIIYLAVALIADTLRQQMGSYASTPASSPLRQQFDHLHVLSVRLETGVLIAGIVALFLTVWQRISPRALPSTAAVSTPANK
jgi:hypothetical protein